MSSSANTLTTLNGLFKEVYSANIEQLIPESYKMLQLVKFSGKEEQIGKQYVQAVILAQEHGVTFGGPTDDVFNLAAPISGNVKDAIVKGYQMVMRSALGYAAVSRAAGGGKKAFKDATKVVVENMMRSFSKKLEIRLMYGQMGLGVVSAKSGSLLTLSTPEYAPGIWVGSENMALEIRNTSGVVTQNNISIVSADLTNKQLTLDAPVASAVAATDIVWERGAYGKEMPGLHKILSNSGTLFDIDASQFSLWKASQYDSGGAALSMEKIQEAVALGTAKGLEGKVVLLCSNISWAGLMTDEAALRQYDVSYSKNKTENGSRQITFFSQNGEIEIMPSIYCKEGYAYIFDPSEYMRIGSTDITFKLPGSNDEFFRQLENSSGYEIRAYTDQSLFTYAPGRSVLMYNIVN